MFDTLRSRMLALFFGTILITTLTIIVVVQLETEEQIVTSQDRHMRNLLETVLLNVDNEHESYVFFKQALLEERKSELENITELAYQQVEGLYTRFQKGELTEAEAKRQAITIIRRMHYAEGMGYLWIQNTEQPLPRLLMHGKQPRLEGKSAGDDPLFYQALNGKDNLFSVFTRLCLTQGQGFVDYRWPKPTATGMSDMQPKTAHLRFFKPWGWIIGTGLYMDDIQRDSNQRLEAILEELRHTFNRVELGATGHVFLFNGQGELLIAPGLKGLDLQAKDPASGASLQQLLKDTAQRGQPLMHAGWAKTPAAAEGAIRTYVVHYAPLDWYIGASVHEDALYAPVLRLRRQVLGIALFFMVLAVALTWLTAQGLTRPLNRLAAAARRIRSLGGSEGIPIGGTRETRDLGSCLDEMLSALKQSANEKERLLQELRDSEENLRTTLNSIGDAVIATDLAGNILRMNPVAERLTGWRLGEIRGQPLSQAFHIIDAKSRLPVRNPMEKVLKEGNIVGLANHTALLARDGSEHQIADSAAPIRDDGGEITGVVLVFRDVSEEYRMREALRETQELQRDVFSNTPSVIYIKDLEGRYLFVNRMYEELFEVGNASIKGKTARDLFHADQAERFHANDLEVVAGGNNLELEETLSRPEGERTYMSIKFPLRRASGEIFAICGVSTDITERKRTETEFRRSSERLRLALQASRMGTWNWDIPENRVVWSAETLAIFAVEADAFGGTYEAYREFIPAELHDGIDRYVQDFLAHPPASKMIHYEHPVNAGDGASKWVEVRGTLFADAQGQPTEMTGVCADITERKQQEEELRQLRNYLSNIIDSMPSTLIGVDREGKVTQWNRAAQRISGIQADAALGRPLAQIYPKLASEMERIDEAIRSRREQTDHKRVYRTNGDTRYEDVTIYPLIANGVEGAVIRIDDVTERLRIEEMMIQTEKMLSVGGLAAGMAHEINNPLGGIMQTAEVMIRRLTGDLQANQRAAEELGISLESIHGYMESRNIPRMLETIRESCRRAAQIVQNMLGFARMADDNVVLCNLAELLDQTLVLSGTDYDLKKRYDFKQIEIVREYADDLPPIQCSPQKLQQVLLNILKNGAQAMQEAVERSDGSGERQPPCFVLRLRQETNNKMIRIEITDNGPGMDETTRKRVFEPFFTTKPAGIGTGLGLSVSYFIVTESLGGSMRVESQPGVGSTFTIRLPMA